MDQEWADKFIVNLRATTTANYHQLVERALKEYMKHVTETINLFVIILDEHGRFGGFRHAPHNVIFPSLFHVLPPNWSVIDDQIRRDYQRLVAPVIFDAKMDFCHRLDRSTRVRRLRSDLWSSITSELIMQLQQHTAELDVWMQRKIKNSCDRLCNEIRASLHDMVAVHTDDHDENDSVNEEEIIN